MTGDYLTPGRHFFIAFSVAMLALTACYADPRAELPGQSRSYVIGTKVPVTLVIDPINKGLGSELPNSLGVAFSIDELRRFFAPEPIPVTPELLAILEEDDRARGFRGCDAYTGDSPVSMIIRPALDHVVKPRLDHNDAIAEFEFQDRPRNLFGLLNLGRVTYSGSQWVGGDNLRLPNRSRLPFGFDMVCGHLRAVPEGGCVVDRDVSPSAHIHYSFCENELPYWREIDNLYFEISSRIIRNPALQHSYRLETAGK